MSRHEPTRAPRRAMVVSIAAALAAVSLAAPAAAAPGKPSITFSPASPGSSRSPSWSFGGEPGVSFECRLRQGPIVVDAWSACSSPQGFDLSGQPDAPFTFEVRSLDIFGEPGPAASSSFVLDTTPPEAPVFTASPPALGTNPSPVWSFAGAPTERPIYDTVSRPLAPSTPSIAYAARSTAEVGELISFGAGERYAARATVVMSDWSTHAKWPEYPAAGWQQPITLNIYAVDRSSGTAAPGALLGSVTQTFTIPWRPAPDPTCPLGESGYRPWRSPDGVCRTNLAAPITFDLGGLQLALPAEVIYGVAFNTDGNGVEPEGIPGPYDELNLGLSAAAPSPGGDPEAGVLYYNSTFGGFYADHGAGGTGTFRRDTGWSYEPVIEVLAGDPPEPAPVAECRLTSGAGTLAEWAPCTPPVSYDLSSRPDGSYTIAIRETDSAGNTGPVATATYTLDRSAPAAPRFTARPASPAPARSPSWSFTDEGAVSFECRLTGAAGAPDWSPCTSPVTFTLGGAVDGPYGVEVRARNGLGTVGPAAADGYVLDTTPPPPPTITRSPRSPGSARTPAWWFTAEPGALVECHLERPASIVRAWSPCASPVRYELDGEPVGNYRFTVRARDRAGNQGEASASTYVLYATSSGGPHHPPVTGSGYPRPVTPLNTGGTAATPPPRAGTSRRRPAVPGGRPALAAAREHHHRTTRGWAAGATAAKSPGPPAGGESLPARVLGALGRALSAFAAAIVRHPDRTVFPLSLLLIVIAFLTLQGRIDRRDPKLALAPVYPDPDLEFPPRPGPATA